MMTANSSLQRNAGLFRALQYFETVARHRSVSLAAQELGVSQSAVSHQLRELTRSLGEQLVVRSGRGIALTESGERLAERLFSTFASLQSSVNDVVGSGRQTLRLAVCTSFGPGWLIPQIKDFIETHPEIDLQLHLYATDPLQTDLVADAIVSAQPVQQGYSAMHLIDEMLVAVHAPGKSGRRHRLITTDIVPETIGQDWAKYCKHARLNLEDIREDSWLQCTHYLLAQELARAGLGVALVPDFLSRREIEKGSLAFFDRTRMPSGRVYNLCFKESRGQEPGIRALARWLKSKLDLGSVVRFGSKGPNWTN